jgi:chemotaxis protein CheX
MIFNRGCADNPINAGSDAMTDLQNPTVSELKNNLIYALGEVFEATFGEHPEIVQPEETVKGLSTIVGLGGNISGYLALHMTPEGACIIAGSMLGTLYAQVDDIVCDAVGELVNMLAGSLKKYSSKNGELFKISIPTIVWGDNYHTHAPKDTEQILMGVKSLSLPFTIQLVVNLHC